MNSPEPGPPDHDHDHDDDHDHDHDHDDAGPDQAWTETLHAAVLDALAAGPRSALEVVEALDAAGIWDGAPVPLLATTDARLLEVEDVVGWDDRVWSTASGVLVDAARLLDGLVLTHRLTAEEAETGELVLAPDLEILDWYADRRLALADGGPLAVEWSSTAPGASALVGPPGWLDGLATGDLLALTRHATAADLDAGARVAVSISRVEEADAAPGTREIAAVRRAVDERLAPDQGEEPVPLLLDALTSDPGAFRAPAPPVADLLAAAGLERRGWSYGRAGQAWRSFSERMTDARLDVIADAWSLDPCCRRALRAAHRAFQAFLAFGSAAEAEPVDIAVVDHLAHGAVAPAFVDVVVGPLGLAVTEVRDFAEALAAAVPARRAAAAHYVAGAAAEHQGQAAEAEGLHRLARQADPSFPFAALALVPYELDRGELGRALALLRHPELQVSPDLVEQIEDLRRSTAPPGGVGRNDPCPCGSGRKFKQCCQSRKVGPIEQRTPLLLFRLVRYAASGRHQPVLAAVAREAGVDDALDDIFLVDAAVFEGGIGARYLDERRRLLDPAELAVVEAMVAERRRLWEVVEVDPAASLTLRDTTTGDRVVVAERRGSLDRSPGELLLARVVTVGAQHQIVGIPLHIPLASRASALALVDADPDAEDLAAWYGALTAIPTLRTREGDPLVLCRAELAVDVDLDELHRALDPVLEVEDRGTWHRSATLPDGDVILRGTVRVVDEEDEDDDRLVVEANAEGRFEALLADVLDALPSATVITEERTDARAAVAARRAGRLDDEWDDEDDHDDDAGMPPEAMAVLDELIRRKEREWVDQSIPALGGLTPSEALDDPTRREDLLAILREMSDRRGTGGFDAVRIRTLLGLPTGEG